MVVEPVEEAISPAELRWTEDVETPEAVLPYGLGGGTGLYAPKLLDAEIKTKI